MAEERVPETIGRYKIRRELGRGMMGVVYEAHDPSLNRPLALKVVRLLFAITDAEKESFERRFLSEARIAARLSHPGTTSGAIPRRASSTSPSSACRGRPSRR